MITECVEYRLYKKQPSLIYAFLAMPGESLQTTLKLRACKT